MNHHRRALEALYAIKETATTRDLEYATKYPKSFSETVFGKTVLGETEQLYKVVLLDHGSNKIACIREIRNSTGLDIYGAKDAAENLPFTIENGLTFNAAKAVGEKFEEIGATVSLNRDS